MTITYKGNNIGLEYDATTATWGLNNTPTDYIDTQAFASTDPDFVYVPPTTDDSEETEEDFNPCPAGYIYDSELKQCVIDPNAESNFMQTMQSGGGNNQPAVKIAGTNRTTSDGNFIASDAEYDAMTAAELVENYKQRGMVDKDDDGNLIIDISPDLGDSFIDGVFGRFSGGGEALAGQKKHLRRLFEKKMIHSDLNPNLMNFYPSGVTSTEDYINKFPMTLLNSGDNAKIKIPTKNDPSLEFVAGDTSTPFTAGFGTSTYLNRELSQGSDKRSPVFGDITTDFNASVSNYASNFANAYITNPNFNPEGTIGTSEEADKFDDLEQSKRREAEAKARKAEAEALAKEQEALQKKKDMQQTIKDAEEREEKRKETTQTSALQTESDYVTASGIGDNSSSSSSTSYTGNEGTGTSSSGGGVPNPHTDTGFSGGSSYVTDNAERDKPKCFHPEQLIGNKFIKDLEPGDLINGIKILGMVKLKLDEDMYSLNDVKVTGTHKVKYNNNWIYVSKHPDSFVINDKPEFVYVPIVEGGTFIINNYEFADYDDEHIETLNNKLKIA